MLERKAKHKTGLEGTACARLYYGEIVSGYAFKVGVHDMVLDNQARSAIKKLLDIHRWSEYGIWYQKARKSTDDDESQKMFVETSRRGRRYL